MTKKIVRIVSAAIVLVLGISLAGCGKKEETKASVAIDGAGEGYEFVTESKSINDLLKTTGYLNNVVVEDGKVYAVENKDGKTVFHIADIETGEDKTFDLDLDSVFPKDVDSENDNEPAGETSGEPAEEGEPAEGSTENEESSEEGEGTTVVTEETGVVYSEEGGMVYEGGDSGIFYYEAGSSSAYISDLCPAEDGSIFLSVFNYLNEKQGRAMCKLTTDGKLEKLYSFDDIADENEGVNYIRVREDGGIYVAVESRVVYVDNTGKTVGTADCGSWINNLFIDGNDNCYASYYGQNGSECKKVDFATGQFTDALETGGIYGSPVIAPDNKVVVAGYDSVFEVNTETKEKTKLWDWVNLDVYNTDTSSFKVNPDGSYSMVSSDYTDDGVKYEYTRIFKQKIDPETARKDIIYGCTYLDYDIRQKISDFNKSQTEYRIRVKSYIDDSGDWNEEEYNNQLARYKADIASGSIDLMSVDATDYSSIQLAKKGAFLDLSEYYTDYTKRSDYFENILDIFKVNDKDYFAIKDVMFLSMIGQADVFKGKDGWTSSDLVELRKQYPDKAFLEYGTKENVLSTMVIFSLNSFLDYEKGTCDFCRPAFYDLLNFANTFPKEINYEDYDAYGMMASGDILVSELYVSDVRSLSMYRQIMGEDSVIIGPPNDNGIKAQVIPESMFAISSKTQYKDGCFQFLKSMEKESEGRYSSSYGLPVLKNAFYDKMKKEITPETYVDENGVTQTIQDSYTVGTSSGSIEIRSANQEDVDIIEDLMINAKDTIRIDDKFAEIFLEEVQPFFEGQKSAEETANVLQSRMKIYLSENE